MFTAEGDVEIFSFYFGNVVRIEKEDAERAFELLVHLDGTVFEFYFGDFTFGGSITDFKKDYGEAVNAFLERFSKQVNPIT